MDGKRIKNMCKLETSELSVLRYQLNVAPTDGILGALFNAHGLDLQLVPVARVGRTTSWLQMKVPKKEHNFGHDYWNILKSIWEVNTFHSPSPLLRVFFPHPPRSFPKNCRAWHLMLKSKLSRPTTRKGKTTSSSQAASVEALKQTPATPLIFFWKLLGGINFPNMQIEDSNWINLTMSLRWSTPNWTAPCL